MVIRWVEWDITEESDTLTHETCGAIALKNLKDSADAVKGKDNYSIKGPFLNGNKYRIEAIE